MQKVIEINENWWVSNSPTKKNKAPKKVSKKKWEQVSLPHVSEESLWYYKRFKVKFKKKSGTSFFIKFENSNADFDIYINGKLAARHNHCEEAQINISSFVKKKMKITIMMDHSSCEEKSLCGTATFFAENDAVLDAEFDTAQVADKAPADEAVV